jgi:hypothetical protein
LATEASPAAEAALKGERTTGFLYELSGVYAAHETASPEIVARLMASADFRDRAWAARLVGIWGDKLEAPLGLLERAIADDHPRVRLEAVVACAWLPKNFGPAAVVLATRVLDRPMDPPLNHALTLCIHSLAPQWKPALAAGTAALRDDAWAVAARARHVRDAARLDALLTAAGAEIAGGTDLFRLARLSNPRLWHMALARRHIWTRMFPYSTEWLRLGLPGSEAQWSRLAKALEDLS